jgi:hypothetical protein
MGERLFHGSANLLIGGIKPVPEQLITASSTGSAGSPLPRSRTVQGKPVPELVEGANPAPAPSSPRAFVNFAYAEFHSFSALLHLNPPYNTGGLFIWPLVFLDSPLSRRMTARGVRAGLILPILA